MPDLIKLPLLKDHHSHPLLYASMRDAIDFSPVESRTEANRIICEYRERNPDAPIVTGIGWKSELFDWTIDELNTLPPMAVFNVSLHALRYNEAGMNVLQDRYGDDVFQIEDIDWYEANLRVVLNWFANLNASAEGLAAFYRTLETLGVGYAEELLLIDENEINLFDHAGLTDRTRFWSAPDTYASLSAAAKERVAGLKLFTDGAIGARTAALKRPFVADGVEPANHGMLIYSDDELPGTIEHCLKAKDALAIHAIGDRSIDQTISVLESIDRNLVSRSYIRIEHAQLIDLRMAKRAKDLGLVLSMQPNFTSDSVCYSDRLDSGYLNANNPFRMLIDEAGFVPGADLIFGSDGMPHGIEYALQQVLFPPYPSQSVTLDEFMAAYCLDADTGQVELEIDHDTRSVNMIK